MRISDWSSDVCSSDLTRPGLSIYGGVQVPEMEGHIRQVARPEVELLQVREISAGDSVGYNATFTAERPMRVGVLNLGYADGRSEEHTSELQSLMRISYAVFCLKKKN